ncbi:MAG: hypothetical protein IJV36_02565 [Prevotella sp.]|nr:hypothetical protein [Prevotella sp.]
MEIVVFDVGNASCNYICSPNKYAMMIDCGSSSDKQNPVDFINYFNNGSGDLFKSKPYVTSGGTSYPLALLHITHPDNDHVRNAERIHKELTPYLLCHTYTEQFDDASTIDDTYKKKLDEVYRGDNPETINWGFDVDTTFSIPIETVKSEPALRGKVRNNSSIIRYIKYNGVRFLFAGDLETAGWEWLSKNNIYFRVLMKQGIDVLIAPHHGHDSGFPKALFQLTGNVKVIILSKDTEASKEGSDVYSGYSNYATGVNYYNINDKDTYNGKVMTTRSNGNIYIIVDSNGLCLVADKASANHKKV